MIRVESTPPHLRTRRANRVKALLIWTQFSIIALNWLYCLFRWLKFIDLIATEEVWLGHFRNAIIIYTTLAVALAMVFVRKFELVRPPAAPASSPGATPNAPPDVTSPRRWRKFEIFVLVATAVLALVNTLKMNAFYPFVDFEPVPTFFRDRPALYQLVDRLVELDILLLIVYASLKIPMAAGALAGTFNRLYVGRWRVHESVFGLSWILVGSLFVLYGEFFDRVLGIFYLLLGAFLIGRDYVDVQKFKFVKGTRPRERGDAGDAGAGGAGPLEAPPASPE